jgi:hypothetical protein
VSDIVEFRKIKPLWVSSDAKQPLAEFSTSIGPREWLFINAETAAISVQDAFALRDWLNRALPKKGT